MGIELGRIKGADLSPNLLRQGTDLAFESDLLYLDVNTQKIGINTDSPTHDLTVNGTVRTRISTTTERIYAGNLIFENNSTIRSTVGPIQVRPTGPDGASYAEKIIVDSIQATGNTISTIESNTNIELRTSGTGTIELEAETNVDGNLSISGNTELTGNLRSFSTITVGNNVLEDTVTISTDFNQTITPGDDALYDIGKFNKRWAEARPETISGVDKFNPQTVYLSSQMLINGITNQIQALQSNEDIVINPDTGVIYIERTKWENSDITNLNTTGALHITTTGRGYITIPGTNGFVMPSGTRAERPIPPQRVAGMTRFNTEDGYIECWSETEQRWLILTGPGATVTEETMEDLSLTYNLIFGV